MIFIKEYVVSQLEEITSIELAEKLCVSVSMISAYKKSYNPSLAVALRAYDVDKVILHPFAEESLKYELGEK